MSSVNAVTDPPTRTLPALAPEERATAASWSVLAPSCSTMSRGHSAAQSTDESDMPSFAMPSPMPVARNAVSDSNSVRLYAPAAARSLWKCTPTDRRVLSCSVTAGANPTSGTMMDARQARDVHVIAAALEADPEGSTNDHCVAGSRESSPQSAENGAAIGRKAATAVTAAPGSTWTVNLPGMVTLLPEMSTADHGLAVSARATIALWHVSSPTFLSPSRLVALIACVTTANRDALCSAREHSRSAPGRTPKAAPRSTSHGETVREGDPAVVKLRLTQSSTTWTRDTPASDADTVTSVCRPAAPKTKPPVCAAVSRLPDSTARTPDRNTLAPVFATDTVDPGMAESKTSSGQDRAWSTAIADGCSSDVRRCGRSHVLCVD
eukprot:Opistho-2@8258